MLNYANLSDVEFEGLCLDVMSAKLGITLHKFARGRDGGIDLRNDTRDVVVQVKHYINSSVEQLLSSLKKEVAKVKKLKPKQYYVCCSKDLSAPKKDEIYALFADYMESDANIITLNEIDEFLIKEEHTEVLKKHYKLWIESTNILEDIFTKDIGIDGEILFSSIQSDMRFFVQTQAYDLALECLKKNRALMIIGHPGVGKTVTSKMLILYFLSKGYRLRYTTDVQNLSELKKSLTLDPQVNEIIFLDDCFGQAYFHMKETQGNELLHIIKHVRVHTNKIIILNSRVTIYSDAKIKTPELIKSFDDKEYKLFMLNMSAVSNVDKAKILYNHLYFNNIDKEHLNAIKEKKGYLQIIEHPNYNPRIIEYVTKESIYKATKSQDYFKFILDNLNNPNQAWRDEYENRLLRVDRLLVTTLFSLSDVAAPYNIVKKCFESRLRNMDGVDTSVNQFECALKRLEESFVKIADVRGRRMLSMANPSINDFMRSYFASNPLEKEKILENSCSVAQLHKLLSHDELDNKLRQLFTSREILDYEFENEREKRDYIAHGIGKYGIKDKIYMPIVHAYLHDVENIYVCDHIISMAVYDTVSILTSELIGFYEVDILLKDFEFLSVFFDMFEFDDLIQVINKVDGFFEGEAREKYLDIAKDKLIEKLGVYCANIYAESYPVDIGEIVAYYKEIGMPDRYYIGQGVEEDITAFVRSEINMLISDLPKDISIRYVLSELNITIWGINEMLDNYFMDFDFDPELLPDKDADFDSEIDLIFNRD